MQGSTRGWVTVNVFWLVHKGPEEVKLVPPDISHQLELCPHASSLHKKSQTDKVPPPVHVSLVKFINSEKASKFGEISINYLTGST